MKLILWYFCFGVCVIYLIVYIILLTKKLLEKHRLNELLGTVEIQSKTKTFKVQDSMDMFIPKENASFEEKNILLNETTETLGLDNEAVDIGYSSLIGTRAYQQDAVRATILGNRGNEEKQSVIGVLCDGMGGMEGGEYASNLAVDRILELVKGNIQDYPTFFKLAIDKVNQEVVELRDSTGKKLHAGSTLVCAMLSGNELYWCTVGDSRIYLYRDGYMKQLNIEHNYRNMINEMLDTGLIREDEINENENPDALTSYLGMEKLRYIDGNLSPISLQEGDVVLLCSDGLYKALSDLELAQILKQLPNLQTAADAMTSLAISIPGAHDNTSVILIRYKGVGSKQAFT